MKKIVSILIALMLLMAFGSSALAKTEDEILFRSIPWGSTYKETISKLEDIGVTWGTSSPYKTGKKELTTGFTVSSKKVKDFSVAGNNVSSIVLYFAYDMNNPTSEDSAVFVQAEYVFETDTNASGIETDLKEKMSSVYSEPDDKSSKSFANDFTHYWYWYGGNNSKVTLYHNYTEPFFMKSMASDELTLTYTSGQMEKLNNAYYEMLNKENNKNTDGL